MPKLTNQQMRVLFKLGWISLAIVGVAILGFGLVATGIAIAGDRRLTAATGVASVGMGAFGLAITLVPYRGRERWAWMSLWYYPAFWTAHLVWVLPPGEDRIHQIVFIVLSLAGLLLPARAFFERAPSPN